MAFHSRYSKKHCLRLYVGQIPGDEGAFGVHLYHWCKIHTEFYSCSLKTSSQGNIFTIVHYPQKQSASAKQSQYCTVGRYLLQGQNLHWPSAGKPGRRTQHTIPYAKLACLVQSYPCTAEGSDLGGPTGQTMASHGIMWQFSHKHVFSAGLAHILSCGTDQLQAAISQSFCSNAKMGVDLRKRPAGQALWQSLLLRRLYIPCLTDLPSVPFN